MTRSLPPAIAAFFQAHNSGLTGAFEELFTGDALVCDEAHEYRGTAIKAWMDGAFASYQPKAEVTDITQGEDRTTVTAQVSGSFPGSPAQLCYQFTLKNGRIAALTIGP